MSKIANILKSMSLMAIAIVILVVIIIFSRECKRGEICPPKGYVLVTEGFIDTLQMIAEMPPDTIRDTIFTRGDIVYVPKDVPIPVSLAPETNFYADSIVNDSINVWIDVTVEGIISEWNWKYRPMIYEREVTIERPAPYPVPYEIPVSKSGLYTSLGVGGNQSAFMLSGELNLITRKDNLYGLQYIRFDQENFYLFKIGTKIKLSR